MASILKYTETVAKPYYGYEVGASPIEGEVKVDTNGDIYIEANDGLTSFGPSYMGNILDDFANLEDVLYELHTRVYEKFNSKKPYLISENQSYHDFVDLINNIGVKKQNDSYEEYEDYNSSENLNYEKSSSSYDSKSDISIMYGGVKDSYNENKQMKQKQREQAKEIFNKGSSTGTVVFKILGLAVIGTLKGFWIFIKMIFSIFGRIVSKDLKKLR